MNLKSVVLWIRNRIHSANRIAPRLYCRSKVVESNGDVSAGLQSVSLSVWLLISTSLAFISPRSRRSPPTPTLYNFRSLAHASTLFYSPPHRQASEALLSLFVAYLKNHTPPTFTKLIFHSCSPWPRLCHILVVLWYVTYFRFCG